MVEQANQNFSLAQGVIARVLDELGAESLRSRIHVDERLRERSVPKVEFAVAPSLARPRGSPRTQSEWAAFGSRCRVLHPTAFKAISFYGAEW